MRKHNLRTIQKTKAAVIKMHADQPGMSAAQIMTALRAAGHVMPTKGSVYRWMRESHQGPLVKPQPRIVGSVRATLHGDDARFLITTDIRVNVKRAKTTTGRGHVYVILDPKKGDRQMRCRTLLEFLKTFEEHMGAPVQLFTVIDGEMCAVVDGDPGNMITGVAA